MGQWWKWVDEVGIEDKDSGEFTVKTEFRKPSIWWWTNEDTPPTWKPKPNYNRPKGI